MNRAQELVKEAVRSPKITSLQNSCVYFGPWAPPVGEVLAVKPEDLMFSSWISRGYGEKRFLHVDL